MQIKYEKYVAYSAIVRKEIKKKNPRKIEDYIRRIDLGENFHPKDFMKLFVISTDNTLNINPEQRKMAADKLKDWVLVHPIRNRDVGRICMKYIAQHDNISSSIVKELIEILDKIGIYYEDKEWAMIVRARVGDWSLCGGNKISKVIDDIIQEAAIFKNCDILRQWINNIDVEKDGKRKVGDLIEKRREMESINYKRRKTRVSAIPTRAVLGSALF